MESLEDDTQLLARNKLVMSLRLCSTARLDLASGWKSDRSKCQSTTAPMSSTACMLARGTSSKIGRNQRAFLLNVLAKLPLCAIVGNKFRVPHANRLICNLRDPCLLDNTNPHFWRPDTPAASAKDVASMLGRPSLSPRRSIHNMA